MPSDASLEGLYKSKLQNSVQLQIVMAVVWSRSCTKQWNSERSAVKNCNETSYWSDDEKSKTLESETMMRDEDQSPKVKKETKAYVEKKEEECFQWKAHGQCSKRDSCSFNHDLLASGNKRKKSETKKDDRLLPKIRDKKGRSSSPASHSKAKQTDGEEQ